MPDQDTDVTNDGEGDGDGEGEAPRQMEPSTDRDWLQIVGVVVIIVGSTLIIAQSLGLAKLDPSTFRYYLAAGVVLSGGTEVVRAVASGP